MLSRLIPLVFALLFAGGVAARDLQVALGAQDEAVFHAGKLREIVLSRRVDGVYELAFFLTDPGEPGASPLPMVGTDAEIPEYVMVEEAV